MPHGSLTEYDQKHHRIRKYLVNKIIIERYLLNAASIFVASDIESFEAQKLFSVENTAVVGLGFPMASGLSPILQKIPSDDLKILFMGRITQKKCLDLTIKALAFLKLNHPKLCLTVAGDGDQKLIQEYKDLAINLNLSDCINFVGWLSSDSKWKAIDASDIFVLNSEDENFAVIVPEVQCRGVPVVLTKKVAFSAFVEKYNSGVVIESLDIHAIVEGFESILKLDYQDLSKNALKCASNSEWDKIISVWISNMNRVINKPYVS
jgi:glycosyltransferase involved in cell wall biosynthesis